MKVLGIGKVVSIVYGSSEGKIGVIIDILDDKRCLIDGPCGRQMINLKRIELTNLKLQIKKKISSNEIHQKFLQNNILKTWYNSTKGKKILKNKLKLKFSDFENFKFMIGKKYFSKLAHMKKKNERIYVY